MKATDLKKATDARIAETREALQLLWNNVNKGQRKQILKKPEIAELFERYGVNTDV